MRRRQFTATLFAAGLSGQTGSESQARRASIDASLRALAAERERHGSGDYKAWYDSLAGLRKELRAAMDRVEPRYLPAAPTRKEMLFTAAGLPPLYCELYTGEYVDPKVPDAFKWIETHPAVEVVRATSLWLKKQGVDLIFVPVPKMSDIYMDRIVGRPLAGDRIIAPHMRQVMHTLLSADVEAVDLLPEMLQARDRTVEPLYLPADSHWSPRGWSIAVKEIAARLSRYPWANAAKSAAPLFTKSVVKSHLPMSVLPMLSAAEKAAVEPFLTPEHELITRKDGKPYGNFEQAPVMVIGDSYSPMPVPQLANAINLPVAMYPVPGGTIQPVKELLRNREALKQARVVVWIVNYAIFMLHDWTGLPEVVKRELAGASR